MREQIGATFFDYVHKANASVTGNCNRLDCMPTLYVYVFMHSRARSSRVNEKTLVARAVLCCTLQGSVLRPLLSYPCTFMV